MLDIVLYLAYKAFRVTCEIILMIWVDAIAFLEADFILVCSQLYRIESRHTGSRKKNWPWHLE